MKAPTPATNADVNRLETWARYHQSLCRSCRGTCCSLPVEVQVRDLVRMGLIDAFDAEEEPKRLAKRLMKDGVIEHFNHKHARFTLTRLANGDCLFLDQKTRLCTVYEGRPDTCRRHPQVGPRPGYCAYIAKA